MNEIIKLFASQSQWVASLAILLASIIIAMKIYLKYKSEVHEKGVSEKGKEKPANEEAQADKMSETELRLQKDNQLRTALFILKSLRITSAKSVVPAIQEN